MDQVCKTRVATQAIEERMHRHELQYVGLFPVSLLEPVKRLLVFAEAKINDNEGRGWDIATLLATFQFSEDAQSVGETPCASVGRCQHIEETRTAVCEDCCFFK